MYLVLKLGRGVSVSLLIHPLYSHFGTQVVQVLFAQDPGVRSPCLPVILVFPPVGSRLRGHYPHLFGNKSGSYLDSDRCHKDVMSSSLWTDGGPTSLDPFDYSGGGSGSVNFQ